MLLIEERCLRVVAQEPHFCVVDCVIQKIGGNCVFGGLRSVLYSWIDSVAPQNLFPTQKLRSNCILRSLIVFRNEGVEISRALNRMVNTPPLGRIYPGFGQFPTTPYVARETATTPNLLCIKLLNRDPHAIKAPLPSHSVATCSHSETATQCWPSLLASKDTSISTSERGPRYRPTLPEAPPPEAIGPQGSLKRKAAP